MKHNFKRFLSLLLALVMVIGVMPMGHVHAEEETGYLVGEKAAEGHIFNGMYIITSVNRYVGNRLTNERYQETTQLVSAAHKVDNTTIWTITPIYAEDGTTLDGYYVKDANGSYLQINGSGVQVVVDPFILDINWNSNTSAWELAENNGSERLNHHNWGAVVTHYTGDNDGGSQWYLYPVTEASMDVIDPWGKRNWTKVSVDSEALGKNATEGEFEKAWDSNPDSIWHSNYPDDGNDKVSDTNFISGAIDFGKAYTINQFSFTSRLNNTSGQVTKASLYVKENEADQWKLVAEHVTFEDNGSKKNICFEEQAVRYVKFVAENSSDGWVTVSEFDIDSTDHTITAAEAVAPTCGAAGYTTYTCSCGCTYNITGEPATGEHVWGEGVYTEPTTEADGYTTYTCTVCPATKVEVNEGSQIVSAFTYDKLTGVTGEASSEEDNDGGSAKPVSNAFDGNVDTFWASEPNSSGIDGNEYLIANLNGKYLVGRVVYTTRPVANAVGSLKNYTIWVSTDGVNYESEATGTVVEDPTSITITFDEPVEATHIKLTATESRHWDNNSLNTVMSAAEFEVYKAVCTAHTPGEAATCITAQTCTKCGAEIAPALGHIDENNDNTCDRESCGATICAHTNTEKIPGKDATCTETGLTEGLKCTDCETVLTEQTEIPVIPHNWVDATCDEAKHCSACPAIEGTALGHTAADDDGDCTTAVYCVRNCGTIVIPAAEKHTYTNDYDSTCNIEGCTATRQVKQFNSEKLTGLTGEASSNDEGDGSSIGEAFDGFTGTTGNYWASVKNDNGIEGNEWLIANLNGENLINKVEYSKRYHDNQPNDGYNCTGNLLDYIIEVRVGEGEWQRVAAGATESQGTTVITFAPIHATQVRLTATQSYHWQDGTNNQPDNRNKVMAVAEFAVYKAVCLDGEHTEGEAVTEGNDTVVYCTVCGTELSRTTIECKHEYEYECSTNCKICGEKTRREAKHVSDAEYACVAGKCRYCGEDVFAATMHNSTSKYACVAGTCEICGMEMPATADHIPNNDDGDCLTEVTCSVCNTVTTPGKENHTYAEEGEVTTAPTCTTDGVRTFKCTVEGCTKVRTEIIPAAHTYGDLIKAVEAVHTPDTLTPAVAAHYYCAACDTYFDADKKETTLEALTGETPKHDEKVTKTENVVDPTLDAAGSHDVVTYCSVCNKEMSRKTEVDPPIASKIVKWYNWDGTVLHELKVAADAEVVADQYVGEPPMRAEDESFTYEFKGWVAVEDGFKAEYTATAKEPVVEADKVIMLGKEVRLESEIQMQYRVYIPESLFNSGAYVVMAKTGAYGEVTKTYTAAELKAGENLVTMGVAPAEITAPISITVYDGNGVAQDLYNEDGVKLDDASRTVAGYAVELLKDDASSDALKDLAVNLLTYGGYAQQFFGVDADNPAFNLLADLGYEVPNLSNITAETLENFKNNQTNTEMGVRVTANTTYVDSNIRIRLYLAVEGDINDYTFTLTTPTGDKVVKAGYDQASNRYYVDITEIASGYIDYEYKITVEGAIGTNEITTSVLSYARSVLNNPNNTEAKKDLVRALYLYNQAANAYYDV